MNLDKNAKITILSGTYLVTLLINGLGRFGIFHKTTVKEVSDKFIVPISLAVTSHYIWWLIYGLLGIALVMAWLKKTEYYEKNIDRFGILFIGMCLCNIIFIVSFCYENIGTALVFNTIHTVLLMLASVMLSVKKEKHILEYTTVGVYGGWMLVLTMCNFVMWLSKNNWAPFTENLLVESILALVVLALLCIGWLRLTKNAVLSLPLAWGCLGIYNRLHFVKEFLLLQILAIIGLVFFAILFLLRYWLNRYSVFPKETKKRREKRK